MCRNWHRHRRYLPRRSAVCGWRHHPHHLILRWPTSGNSEECHSEQRGSHLPVDVSVEGSNNVAYLTLTLVLSFPLVCMLFATTAIMTTSSRMCYAFARDGGLPASPFFSKVHPKLNVPLNALYLNLALVIIFGLIFLGSTR